MLVILLIILTTAFFMLLSAAVLFTLFKRKISFTNRLESYFGVNKLNLKQQETGTNETKKDVIIKFIWKKGTEQVNKKISLKERKNLSILLRDAGLSQKIGAVEFRLLQLLLSLGSALLIIVLMYPSSDKKALVVLFALTVGLLGYRYPLFYLSKKKTLRIKQINIEMPDFFDTVNLLIEAGVGLDSAISQVCQKKKSPLSDEFLLTLDDMKRGKSRREAFYELRKRVPSDSFQSVITSLIQADQLGVGMAKVLRNLTIRIREQRREAAREQAMKAPIKMLFPMAFFIFPSLFIVILGPMIITVLSGGLSV